MHEKKKTEIKIEFFYFFFEKKEFLLRPELKKKNDLILEFRKELDYKDQLYVDSLKKFRIDIQNKIELFKKQKCVETSIRKHYY